MQHHIFTRSIAILVALVFIVSPNSFSYAREAKPGKLVVYSITEGASLYIDDEFIAKLPMEKPIDLSPGIHTIKVSLRGYSEFVDTVEIKVNKSSELEIDLIPFGGIVRIDTATPGATVKVDGRVEGVTPFDKDIAIGKREITVSFPGFYENTQTVDIQAGKNYDLKVDLVALPESKQKDSEPEFYETWWFWTAIGVVAVGATTTAVVLSQDKQETYTPTPDFNIVVP